MNKTSHFYDRIDDFLLICTSLSKLRDRPDAVYRGDASLSLVTLQPGIQNLQVLIKLKDHIEYIPTMNRILLIV